MADSQYVVLDTRVFDMVINMKESLIKRYDTINETYDRIVENLLSNWIGNGAEAFKDDANNVKANIIGIYDILKIMCDTLTDCKAVFEECDKALGEYNRNPGSN